MSEPATAADAGTAAADLLPQLAALGARADERPLRRRDGPAWSLIAGTGERFCLTETDYLDPLELADVACFDDGSILCFDYDLRRWRALAHWYVTQGSERAVLWADGRWRKLQNTAEGPPARWSTAP